MEIEILKVGELQANCYLISINKKCIIIDPGDEENFIISKIRKNDLIPIAVITTHHHPDHTKYAKSISELYNINHYNYNTLFEKKFNLGDFNFQVIYTPGHTKDSISLYFYEYDVMFTGDFLFNGTIGRVDLPGGSTEDMIKSIEKIKKFSPNIKIYPGHGDITTLKDELKYNKYLK